MKKVIWLILIIGLIWPLFSRAAVLKSSYPRLANYFLKWEISDQEAKELAQWDLLILDMEVQENSRAQLQKIRQLNPRVIILAYITSQEIIEEIDEYNSASLRQRLGAQLIDSWWLRDSNGNKISNWPNTAMLNLSDGAGLNWQGQHFNDYLPEFIVNNIKASGLWDGVFYDNTWGDISWLNNGNLDLNNDGLVESKAEADLLWSLGFKKMLAKTRELAGPEFIIIGNGRSYEGYQNILNGMMLEDFPSSWENDGTWAGSMKNYFRYPAMNQSPPITVINVIDKNQNNYRHLRFGLTSALLGNGYFSFDYDITNHGQIWRYDEYDVNLGPAQTSAYNLLTNSIEIKPSLWRRDFKQGSVIINSTSQTQTYVFLKEELEKIKGQQDPVFNNGQRINYIRLAPQEGIVLLKTATEINNSPFTNGYFFRVFNPRGEQLNNGFFAYLGGFPGENEIIMAAGSDSEQLVSLSAGSGKIELYKNSQKLSSISPFDNLFTGQLSIAAQTIDGYINQVVVGPGLGGGPQVRIFTLDGKLHGSFFAYDKKGRGGVNVALGDVDSDGQLEIITGPGKGEKPLVKIFSLRGVLKNSFFAYDQGFRGGVGVAVADVLGDEKLEIITGPQSGGGPHVRIFSDSGQVLGSFFAYDKSYHGGIKVTTGDVNEDGQSEILVGIKNFY